MVSDDEVTIPTGIQYGVGMATEPNDQVDQNEIPLDNVSKHCIPPVSKDGIPLVSEDGKSPVSEHGNPPFSDNGVSSFSGYTNRSYSESQVDGATDKPDTLYSRNPSGPQQARVQGISWLKACLGDPHEEISQEICKTRRFKWQHSSNERCKAVRQLFTGAQDVDNKSVPFVLATWCMLAGAIPAIWKESHEGNKTGPKRTLVNWGTEMLQELDQLLLGQKSGLKHCND